MTPCYLNWLIMCPHCHESMELHFCGPYPEDLSLQPTLNPTCTAKYKPPEIQVTIELGGMVVHTTLEGMSEAVEKLQAAAERVAR